MYLLQHFIDVDAVRLLPLGLALPLALSLGNHVLLRFAR